MNSTAQTKQYHVSHGRKKMQTGDVSIPVGASGHFADTSVDPALDFETRMKLLYLNWDRNTRQWHTNLDYSVNEVKDVVKSFKNELQKFAKNNSITL